MIYTSCHDSVCVCRPASIWRNSYWRGKDDCGAHPLGDMGAPQDKCWNILTAISAQLQFFLKIWSLYTCRYKSSAYFELWNWVSMKLTSKKRNCLPSSTLLGAAPKTALTFNEALLLQCLQRRPLHDQLLQPALHPLPLCVLEIWWRTWDCRGTGGGVGKKGGGGQHRVFSHGSGQKMGWDGGKNEKREGRAVAQVRQDWRRDDLPRGMCENVSGLDGWEDRWEDGGM